MENLKKRMISFLYAIPDISELTMCPSIFSDDINKHDCDNCKASKNFQSDTYDDAICRDCWEQAIINCE